MDEYKEKALGRGLEQLPSSETHSRNPIFKIKTYNYVLKQNNKNSVYKYFSIFRDKCFKNIFLNFKLKYYKNK